MIVADKWTVFELPDGVCRLFASWWDDSWRLNSGIVKVEEDEDSFIFHGRSGSEYHCPKDSYGITSHYNAGVLAHMIDIANGIQLGATTDWVNREWIR